MDRPTTRREVLRLGAYSALAGGLSAIPDFSVASNSAEPLRIIAHESFKIPDPDDPKRDLLQPFFEKHLQSDVVIDRAHGDAGQVLDFAITTRGEGADLLFGIDNVSYTRAIQSRILQPYRSANFTDVRNELLFDRDSFVTPIDYGYISLNYDIAAVERMRQEGFLVPARLDELTQPHWRGKISLQDPNTSSTGQLFFLATIGHFGDKGDGAWQDFWRRLKANDVVISSGWEESYYEVFSRGSNPKKAIIVTSYDTSPLAELSQKTNQPLTANLNMPFANYLQVEGVGILSGARNTDVARRAIDFMLSPAYQEYAAAKMFMYPVRSNAKLSEEFKGVGMRREYVARLDPERIQLYLNEWLDTWTELMAT